MSLRKLIEAVERGEEWISRLSSAAFANKEHAVLACRAYGHHGQPGTDGSLDAAKALHEALLPGWCPGLSQNVHGGHWYAWLQTTVECVSAFNDNPARAWLLAILRAVEAKEATP